MASFELPPINDNPDGGWGPSPSNFPAQFKFKDIPYAPYSKSDKLGRFADWNDISGDNRQATGPSAGQTGTRAGRSGRQPPAAFGSGAANAFAYFHVEDESSFSVVANTAGASRRGGAMSRGKNNARGGFARTAQRGARGGPNAARGGGAGQRGGRRGWRDWDKVQYRWRRNHHRCSFLSQGHRAREGSVIISPEWAMLEEVEFIRLSKLRLDVDTPEDVYVTSTHRFLPVIILLK
jgi:translation initiation factor 3 subunit D